MTIVFWLKLETQSAALAGAMMMAVTLPAVLLAPVGGALADLLPKKHILIFFDSINGLMLLICSAVLMSSADSMTVIAVMFAVAILYGATTAFFGPALMSFIPELVR